jgi:hypothetical protein
MQKSFKIIDTEELGQTFTKVGNMYELKNDSTGEIIFSGTDTEDGFRFDQKIGKEVDYYRLDALKLFLEMVGKCDSMIFEKYNLYEKVKL